RRVHLVSVEALDFNEDAPVVSEDAARPT
ncbi:MAG: magnesium/cobalt efflux protein, partial [Gammaproteobacteria bacterium]|nr:magnesium/cobalt efflux protein [Gammaproteobacteria bacterium]